MINYKKDFIRFCESTSEELTKEYLYPPTPIVEVAEKIGVQVIFADFGEFGEVASSFSDFEKNKIYINKEEFFEKKCLCIAMEIANFILFKDFYSKNECMYNVTERFKEYDLTNKYVKDAYVMASHILIPERFLKKLDTSNVVVLTRIFAVPRLTMERRIKKNSPFLHCINNFKNVLYK